MDLPEKFNYWLDIAQYDLRTAEAMFETGRWFYVVFMCQQSIEKLVKGLYLLYIDDNIPRLHDINGIFDRFESKLSGKITEDQANLFDTLSTFYLRNRYPDYTPAASTLATEDFAQTILEKTKEAFQWLLTMKP